MRIEWDDGHTPNLYLLSLQNVSIYVLQKSLETMFLYCITIIWRGILEKWTKFAYYPSEGFSSTYYKYFPSYPEKPSIELSGKEIDKVFLCAVSSMSPH